MLGNGDDDAATVAERLVYLKQDSFVFIDMLKDIEGSDNIKLAFERDSASIHLEKLCPPQALRGAAEARAADFAARQPEMGEGLLHSRKYEPGSTADLEHIFSVRKIFFKRPEN